MEGEEGGGIRLSKRFDDYNKKSGGGGGGGGDEVDYKNKSGTAWSHSYLNQKPWHPLSYPNQRRKWIAEQTHAQRERRTEEVAREYAQEQEFFRQTALISKKEKEKIEMMKAVSFMYVRPPGYNAESAKAAEIADASQPPAAAAAAASSSSNSMHPESVAGDHKKKPRPKDAFGRPLPTQEEFQVLTNAPRLETGVPARVKPFGIEVRNVKCLRCGKYGHQSGDRECPLKDVIMPNEESRLKRDDPLTAIVAQTDPSEPLKWELKQKPGISPPRGGFNPDDPNQQIVAEDIFDEYGGFLSGGNIPDLLTNFSPSDRKKKSKRSKHKKEPSPSREIWEENGLSSPSNKEEKRSNEEKKRKKKKRLDHSESSSSEDFMFDRHPKRNKHRHSYSSEVSDSDRILRNKKSKKKHYHSSESDSDRCRSKSSRKKDSYSTVHFHSERRHRSGRDKQSYSHLSTDSKFDRQRRGENHSHRHFHRSDS